MILKKLNRPRRNKDFQFTFAPTKFFASFEYSGNLDLFSLEEIYLFSLSVLNWRFLGLDAVSDYHKKPSTSLIDVILFVLLEQGRIHLKWATWT